MTASQPQATNHPQADHQTDTGHRGPKSVACPTCGADPEEPCRRPSGHEVWNGSGNVHAARRKRGRSEETGHERERKVREILRNYDGGEIGTSEMEAALQVSSDALTEKQVAAGAWRILKSAQIMAQHGRNPRTEKARKMIGQVPFRIAEVEDAAREAGVETEALAETLSPPVPDGASGKGSERGSEKTNQPVPNPEARSNREGKETETSDPQPMPQGHRRSFREWRTEVDEALADSIGVVTAVLPGVAWRRAYHRGMTTTSAAEQARWMWSNGVREEEGAKRRKRRLTVLLTSDRIADVKKAADEASEDLIRAALRLCGPSQQTRIESALTEILRKRHPES